MGEGFNTKALFASLTVSFFPFSAYAQAQRVKQKKATPYGGLWVVGMTGLPSVNLGGGVQYQSPVRFAHGV
ncbi:MAG: hypothetical protein KGZ82_11875, partial [Bacteroidales bacterium]|nr:hypothetical protein [Bacteroidales bacterium]